jgi:hypothetical protein
LAVRRETGVETGGEQARVGDDVVRFRDGGNNVSGIAGAGDRRQRKPHEAICASQAIPAFDVAVRSFAD